MLDLVGVAEPQLAADGREVIAVPATALGQRQAAGEAIDVRRATGRAPRRRVARAGLQRLHADADPQLALAVVGGELGVSVGPQIAAAVGRPGRQSRRAQRQLAGIALRVERGQELRAVAPAGAVLAADPIEHHAARPPDVILFDRSAVARHEPRARAEQQRHATGVLVRAARERRVERAAGGARAGDRGGRARGGERVQELGGDRRCPGQPHPAVDGGHRVARHEARVEPGQRPVIEHAQERHLVRVAVGMVRGRAGVERGWTEVAAPVEVALRGVDRLPQVGHVRVADLNVAALDRRVAEVVRDQVAARRHVDGEGPVVLGDRGLHHVAGRHHHGHPGQRLVAGMVGHHAAERGGVGRGGEGESEAEDHRDAHPHRHAWRCLAIWRPRSHALAGCGSRVARCDGDELRARRGTSRRA